MMYIALGSNIGDRVRYLTEAIERMEADGFHVTRQSNVYETAPVGYLDQPSFYNMVVEASTNQSPAEALAALQTIERELGRERLIKNGPRTIDLDILWFKGEDIQSERLVVPHPRLHERAFVLAPFSEIAPEIVVHGATMTQWLERLPQADRQDVVRLGQLVNLRIEERK